MRVCKLFYPDTHNRKPSVWTGLSAVTVLRGGSSSSSSHGAFACGEPGYYALLAAQFVWTLGFAAYHGRRVVAMTAAKVRSGYPFRARDVRWDPRALRLYGAWTLFAGVVAGLVGIGGGMVLGPLMLAMGVDPRVSTATTGTMVLLTSSTVAFMAVAGGDVSAQYAVHFASTCLVGAYAGRAAAEAHVGRTGRTSPLVGALAGVACAASAGCAAMLIGELRGAGWCLEGFGGFCDANDAAGGDGGAC